MEEIGPTFSDVVHWAQQKQALQLKKDGMWNVLEKMNHRNLESFLFYMGDKGLKVCSEKYGKCNSSLWRLIL